MRVRLLMGRTDREVLVFAFGCLNRILCIWGIGKVSHTREKSAPSFWCCRRETRLLTIGMVARWLFVYIRTGIFVVYCTADQTLNHNEST